jgi:tight adherence protein C
MVDLILSKVYDQNFMLSLFAAISVAATILTLSLPLLERDEMKNRMKSVALERDRLRARAREQMARNGGKPISLRNEPGVRMRELVERFDLMKHLGTEDMKHKLRMAGHRGQAPLYAFIVFRLVMPFVTFGLALVYLFGVSNMEQPAMIKIAGAIFAAWVGFRLPGLFVDNQIQKRQTSIKRAFPDALDLLLICVESGMSIEVAFRKVAAEIGGSSVPLAEELSLTTAELSYLQDRRMAYENLAQRTGLDGVKAVCMALIQSEKYGTSLGTTLRVMAQENRDMRMSEAEKKAAALPPQRTVPMIVFFLPVLCIVSLGPAGIRVTTTIN